MDDPIINNLTTLLSSTFLTINADASYLYFILLALGMTVLLGLSALISASEIAFFSLEEKNIDLMMVKQRKSALIIKKLLREPEKLLATILIANNLLNIAFILLSTILIKILSHWITSNLFLQIFQLIGITAALVLFGEIMPKVLATKKFERLSILMAKPLYVLKIIFKPFSAFLMLFSKRNRKKKEVKSLSVDELSAVHDLIQNDETSETEQQILSGILNFGNTDVKQVMTSRIDIEGIQESDSFTEVIKIIQECGFSRIPVYQENIDKITGVLYIKDLIPHLDEGEQFDWKVFIRDAYFVPESKKIDDLLHEFQIKKMHLAVVVDEYGGTSGIVTMEDVIEEIVGDISDEFDDEDIIYSKLDKHNFVFDGKTALVDVYRVVDIEGDKIEAKKGESDSLAGFILELTGEMPEKGEIIEFEDLKFKIESVDKRRIKRIKMTLPKEK